MIHEKMGRKGSNHDLEISGLHILHHLYQTWATDSTRRLTGIKVESGVELGTQSSLRMARWVFSTMERRPTGLRADDQR